MHCLSNYIHTLFPVTGASGGGVQRHQHSHSQPVASIWWRVRAGLRGAIADWSSGLEEPEGRSPPCGDWLTCRRLAPEMAASERRGLARWSPAEWGPRLLLLLRLGGCSGRIHRLVLTVSSAERRSGAGAAALSRRSPWLRVVLACLPRSFRGTEQPGAPAFRPGVVSPEDPPQASGWSCPAGSAGVASCPSGAGLPLRGPPRHPLHPASPSLSSLNSWGRQGESL